MSRVWNRFKQHVRAHTKRDVLLLIACLILLGASVILFWFSTLSIPDISLFTNRQVTESTKIYDRNGVLLYDASGSVRKTVVDSDQISNNVKDATVAIEDQDFYTEGGIRLLSILRAIIVNITTLGYSQGGSTITQQVIKNSLLTNDKTIARKIKEWILAIRLEKIYSKDQILTTYLNEVPYGGNVYGVEEASKEFFNEDASDLDIAQAAYIAAIPQAPTFYSPYGANKASLDARQKVVLQKMLSLKFITQDQYNQAVAENVVFQPNNGEAIKAPWFVMYVKQYLESTYGVDEVETGGLTVTTTLDYALEQKMEQSVHDYITTQGPNFGMSNAASMAIDPKNGDILAMVGSYDYDATTTTDGNFNAATGANRQPGSTFKPIAYSVGFEKGYTPDTVLFDLPTEFNSSCGPDGQPLSAAVASSTCYMPQDFDGTYRGPISLRTALALSINIPSIELLYLGGLQDSLNLAQQMGITTLGSDPNQYGLTLVLGGGEVSLLEMTSAYGTFANDGVHVPYRSILSVTDSSGNVLEQANPDPVGTQVMPANIARTISDILSDDQARASEYGLHSVFDIPGYNVAAKTGTTNNTKDVWTIGYSPDIVVGVWGGNNDGTPLVKKIAGLIIAPLWNTLMTEAVASTTASDMFTKPAPIDGPDAKPAFRGIWQGGQTYTIDTVSGKLATQYTPPETQKEVAVTDVHSILYWVDKNDPQGPPPADPNTDPQFTNWEAPARAWAQTQGLTDQTDAVIPTATDDIHVPANFPQINVVGWDPNKIYTPTDSATINFTVNGKYPIQKILVYGNGGILQTLNPNQRSFTFNISAINSLSDTNQIEISAVDSVFDKAMATTTLQVNTGQSQ